MNAEAILTPGGIADQLGGSLSGVAMALQRRSEQNRQMQMQDQQMQQQMQQQEFQNRHMLRREDRQDRRDSAADALGQRQMTLQEHIQSRLEEAGRARAQSDTSRETENRRQFDVGQGIMSPAGEQAQTPVANALVGGSYGASAALSQDDQAAMRNRTYRDAKTTALDRPVREYETPDQRAARETNNIETKENLRAGAKDLQTLRTQRQNLVDALGGARVGRPTIGADKPYWGTGDYAAKDVVKWDAANPRYAEAQSQLDALDAQIKALEGGGARPSLGAPPSSDQDAIDAGWERNRP